MRLRGGKEQSNYYKEIEIQEATQGIHLQWLPGHKTQLR